MFKEVEETDTSSTTGLSSQEHPNPPTSCQIYAKHSKKKNPFVLEIVEECQISKSSIFYPSLAKRVTKKSAETFREQMAK